MATNELSVSTIFLLPLHLLPHLFLDNLCCFLSEFLGNKTFWSFQRKSPSNSFAEFPSCWLLQLTFTLPHFLCHFFDFFFLLLGYYKLLKFPSLYLEFVPTFFSSSCVSLEAKPHSLPLLRFIGIRSPVFYSSSFAASSSSSLSSSSHLTDNDNMCRCVYICLSTIANIAARTQINTTLSATTSFRLFFFSSLFSSLYLSIIRLFSDSHHTQEEEPAGKQNTTLCHVKLRGTGPSTATHPQWTRGMRKGGGGGGGWRKVRRQEAVKRRDGKGWGGTSLETD